MTYSSVQLNDLPDEILLIIFKKLNNIEVLSSLFNVNKRLNKIVHDSIFTSDLTLLKYLSHNSTYSLPDPLLDRFCSEILPEIHHKIKLLTLESLSMKRILLSTNYPNLDGLGIYNIKKKTALSLFTDEITFTDVFKNQILSFVIEIIDKDCYEPNMNIIIFTNIFKNFTNLKYLNFNPSFICDQHISFNWSSPTIFSSTLLTLHVKVSSVIDCLHLLDGRFNQLHTLYLHTASAYSRQKSLKITNKEKLPNLRCFSLSSAEKLDLYDEIIIPLLHRMSNLEILMLYFPVSKRRTFIDGNNLKAIINHMSQLNKFLFNICSFIHFNNQKINLPSNEDIQYSFKDFNYDQIISCVNYFPEAKCDSNHIKYRIELFYNARYIIGVHSGALSNMNFAQSNITIIELMPYKSSTSSLRMTCSMFNSDDLKACAVIYYILNFNYLIKLIGFYLFLLMIKEI
ncbi:unnamed protein product [Rotaria sp. Silwood2]|nr:unnamed protein product [Rotaria sp. Silwood2]